MKQILQNFATGQTELVDIPCPEVKRDNILIRNDFSVVSSGTEGMLIDFAKAGLIGKALQQPAKVKMVIDKIKTDGLFPTIESVRNKLGTPIPMGYSSSGVVIGIGEGVHGFKLGDRVASNGSHGEIVSVPENLCIKIPDNVSGREASFTVISAIAMQGVRLAEPALGENFAVIGLGLIGLITVQILQANGCRVIGFDYDEERLKLAEKFGTKAVNLKTCPDSVTEAAAFSNHYGIDGVLITAATDSNDPVTNAARMCRKRGRIILVGVSGLDLDRNDFYEKELTFQVSCSYGPGRYEPSYEEKGMDYPIGFVRWTENRNFQAVLQLIESGKLKLDPLITHSFDITEMTKAYELLNAGSGSLGIIFEYKNSENTDNLLSSKTVENKDIDAVPVNSGQPVIACIGCGNYANQILIPAFKKGGAILHTVVSTGGINASSVLKKHKFKYSTTDIESVFTNDEINTIVIATRHDTHALFITKALKAGKNVFVEKPLAVNTDEIKDIANCYNEICKSGSYPILMTGFNRRFSPLVQTLNETLKTINDKKAFIMTVNAGEVPGSHWAQSTDEGGGRIIGEACHFVDIIRFLADDNIISVSAIGLNENYDLNPCEDKVSIHLKFRDGSIGVINYLANGSKSYPKERLEVFTSGKVFTIDNFKKLAGYGLNESIDQCLWSQDKGNYSCVQSFLDAIKQNRPSPVNFNESAEVTAATLAVLESLKSGSSVKLEIPEVVSFPEKENYDFSKCKLCKANSGKPEYRRTDSYSIYVCSSCGFHYIDYLDSDKPDESADTELSKEDEEYIEKQLQSNKERLNTKIDIVGSNMTIDGSECLDIGAGGGLFCSELKSRGAKVEGIEPNRTRQLFAEKKYSLNLSPDLVSSSSWQDAKKEYFDLVTLWDVVEHVNFPIETMEESLNLLKPGGLFCIDTPARDSFFHRFGKFVAAVTFGTRISFLNMLYSSKPFEHKQIFSTSEIRKFAESHKLEVVKLEKFSELSFPAEFFMKRIFKSETIARILAPAAGLVFKIFKFKNKIIFVGRKKTS
ncbi:MAG: methyltransferase domain-containing protein [Planctomycetota bacterium]|jgi:predicted dehydrogenase/2-polyprenyl-3-methyl-5-hydroxy-6-metoxy-1,4-benzoquinol methylase